MKNFKFVNNIVGWLSFAIAAVTYLLTIEPTASFWDCGEFISTAYKLDVGHPPGAPFFMLTGHFFSLFASNPSTVAMMINAMSALFSALTILFLFWTITHLARKIIIKNENEISTSQMIGIMGAGLVGALAYTFSDTFWFSAVEGEVYAYSSLFTAVVFWAILKWEDVADEAHSDRWLIFIAYLTGLSIGVHLLNLLAIPAVALVYYFKNYQVSAKGIILNLLSSFAIVGVVMYGFIQGSVEMASWFELFFVNGLGASYNTGAIVYVIFVVAILAWSIYESYAGKSNIRMKISLLLSIVILGIPFIGSSIWLPTLIVVGLIVWLAYAKINRRFVNLVVLCLSVLFIGYSTYAVIVVRSLAKPSMDQNSPDNMFALKSYLNREQYGDTPLFYGQYYNSEVKLDVKGGYCIPVINEGEKMWMKDTVTGGKDKYIGAGRKMSYKYADDLCTIFPRMYSSQEEHIAEYKTWGKIEGVNVAYDKCGRLVTIAKPTFIENLRFFFSYQVNFMYWRYFMWNFSGRQNDIQGHGEVNHGNWITGINAIDELMVGDQINLPPDLESNKGHNVYYMLPLLLGLLGICFQVYSGKKGVESFWITFMLFFMTGLAIVIYLNQIPLQPRERDYAYAGSFYAFAIWIGFGVLAIIQLLQRFMPKTVAAIIASLATLGVPALMANQNWDDHDRSGRRTCADFGYNYLMSCEPNAIIFTNGDNDTFPLWYMQEVEGVRTDVRVCNLSYLQTDWYINQMRRGYYGSKALPINLNPSKYAEGVRTAGVVNNKNYPVHEEWIDKPFELGTALDFYGSDDQRAKDSSGDNYMPSQNLYMEIDAAQVLKTGTVKQEDSARILSVMPIKLRTRIYKNEYAILNLLYNNNWERPVYYAYTTGNEAELGLRPYSKLEGIARRIVPLMPDLNKDTEIDTEKMYDNMMHKYRWGGIENPKVYLDENNLRFCSHFRMLFSRLAEALIKEGKNDKALEVLDYSLKVIPLATVPSDYTSIYMAESYYALGENKKAKELITELLNKTDKSLSWFFALNNDKILSATAEIYQTVRLYQGTLSIVEKYDTETYDAYKDKAKGYYEKLYMLQ